MKSKRIYSVIAAAMCAVFVWLGVTGLFGDWAQAASYSGDNVSIAASDIIDGALYATGKVVTVNGTVKGDVYCAGQTVTITGVVEGDVICAAQTMKVAGEVLGDVRAAAQTVDFGGLVGGSVSAFAQTVTIGEGAAIARDLNGAAETVTHAGNIGRDVLIAAQTGMIDGGVGRNVEGDYAYLTLSNAARVGGNLYYTSKNEAAVAQGAVSGEVARFEPTVAEELRTEDTKGAFAMAVYFFLSMLLVALVLALVAPSPLRMVTNDGLQRPLLSLLTGFFVVFAGPLIIGLVAATVIGIPLAILLLLLWTLALVLSGPIFAFYIGRLLIEKQSTHALLIMVVGATALLLTYFVPVLNIVALLSAGTMGTGMIVMDIVRRYERPAYSTRESRKKKRA